MQRPHRPVRVNKLPHVLQRRMHQCKVYIKRKLRVWRGQKCTFLVSAKLNRPLVVNKLPRVLQRRIWQAIEIFKTSGLPIDMLPCLHQCNAYIVRKLRVWRAQNSNFLVSAKTAPTGMGQHTTPCLAAPYWARNEKFSKFWGYFLPWYRVCTTAKFILKGSYGCGEPKNAIS